jgi:hypothetical protein
MGFDYTDAVFKIRVTTIELEQDGETTTVPYTGIDHAVLNALANRANNETGKCWPGYGLLAEDTHFSRRAVMRAVAKLEQIGFITTEITDQRSTNTYTLHMDKLVAASLLSPAKNKGKSKKLRGKHTGKKLDLYSFDQRCESCGEVLTDCGCAYLCQEIQCFELSGSVADHIDHLHTVHGLKRQPIGGRETMQLCRIPRSAKVAPKPKDSSFDDDLSENELDFLVEPQTTSFNIEGDEDEDAARVLDCLRLSGRQRLGPSGVRSHSQDVAGPRSGHGT